jgi:hypothetical protein
MTIDKFIASKTRIKIIKQYVFNPQQSYHIRELVRILKDEVNAIRRELINLEHAGLLVSQKQSNKICYTINHDYYLLSELQNIFHKEYGLGAQIIKNKKQLGEINFIILTHTFLTLSESSADDLDMIIIGNPDERILEAMVKNAEDELKRDIFYTIWSEKEWDNRKRRKDPQTMSTSLLPHLLIVGDPIQAFV